MDKSNITQLLKEAVSRCDLCHMATDMSSLCRIKTLQSAFIPGVGLEKTESHTLIYGNPANKYDYTG